MTPEMTASVTFELDKLQARGGNHGFLRVKAVVEATGASRDDVRALAASLGVKCDRHGKYGYCLLGKAEG